MTNLEIAKKQVKKRKIHRWYLLDVGHEWQIVDSYFNKNNKEIEKIYHFNKGISKEEMIETLKLAN